MQTAVGGEVHSSTALFSMAEVTVLAGSCVKNTVLLT